MNGSRWRGFSAASARRCASHKRIRSSWSWTKPRRPGRLMAVLRSLFHGATTGVMAFLAAFGLFVGYAMGIAFIIIAIMKPIFPNNVGFWMTPNGILVSSGVNFPAVREGLVFHTSYWIIPGALLIGLVLVLGTHVLARRWIAWFRSRRKWRHAPE